MTAGDAVLSARAGHRALRGGRAGVRGDASVIWVEGPDASTFLHGLLTQDIAAIDVGSAAPALLLDAKGHIHAAMRVHRDGDSAYTLVARSDEVDGLATTLRGYHFSEDLEILGPEPATLVTLAGVDRGEAGEIADLVLPGEVPGTLDALVADAAAALAALGLPEAPVEAMEAVRIEAGVPRVGVDTAPTTLVQEAGLEATAVSFDKGCYLGQETVARVAHRGAVRRRLRGLLLAEPVPAGAPVEAGGREVGRATSVAVSPERGPVALAILRREAEPGTGVRAGRADARVVEVPFPDA